MTGAGLAPELEPVLEAILAVRSRAEIGDLEVALRGAGWEPIVDDSDGDGRADVDDGSRRWSAPASPASSVPPAAAWIPEAPDAALGAGLIIAAETDDDARRIRDDIRDRIESATLLRPTDGDEFWARWSDGVREVSLAHHPASTLLGAAVPPSVQLDVDPIDPV